MNAPPACTDHVRLHREKAVRHPLADREPLTIVVAAGGAGHSTQSWKLQCCVRRPALLFGEMSEATHIGVSVRRSHQLQPHELPDRSFDRSPLTLTQFGRWGGKSTSLSGGVVETRSSTQQSGPAVAASREVGDSGILKEPAEPASIDSRCDMA